MRPVELEPADTSRCSFYVENLGHVPESIRLMFNSPEIARAFVELNRTIMAPRRIDPALKRLVGLYVALQFNCGYAAGHAIAGALRLGVRSEVLLAVSCFRDADLFDDRQSAALGIAAATVDSMLGQKAGPSLPRQGPFTPAEVAEIVAACCGYCFMSFWNTAIPPVELPAPAGSPAMAILQRLMPPTLTETAPRE